MSKYQEKKISTQKIPNQNVNSMKEEDSLSHESFLKVTSYTFSQEANQGNSPHKSTGRTQEIKDLTQKKDKGKDGGEVKPQNSRSITDLENKFLLDQEDRRPQEGLLQGKNEINRLTKAFEHVNIYIISKRDIYD